jgi:hypothetical protein
MTVGDTVFLTDAVPYAQELDQGYSPKAPANFWEMAAEQAVHDQDGADWAAQVQDRFAPF